MKTKKKGLLSSHLWDSRVPSDHVSTSERWLGYVFGPFSVIVMNSILGTYLNVYYTDVLKIGSLWGGWFLSLFPIVVRCIDAFTFILMGMIVDRVHSRQGKARPWILFAAPLLVVSTILLFLVPTKNETLLVIWIFLSYNLFYSVAYTAYGTAHTLLVPLATKNPAERDRLSVMTNIQPMIAGAIVAVLFPTFLVPAMGVERKNWIFTIGLFALIAFPLILLEYFFTRERVTEEEHGEAHIENASSASASLSLRKQFSLCMRSRSWKVLMLYLILTQVTGCLFNASTFYYCNWVLGTYNDGFTQMLFYAIGNAPLGLGIFICRPLCKRLGKKRAMQLGYLLAAAGTVLCLLNADQLKIVLLGQIIRSFGLIPSTFLTTSLLADALDDVHAKTNVRCDGFSSGIFNVISTLATGLGLCILNLGISKLGYAAPSDPSALPVQNDLVRSFFIFCTIGCQTLVYPLIALLLHFFEEKKDEPGL